MFNKNRKDSLRRHLESNGFQSVDKDVYVRTFAFRNNPRIEVKLSGTVSIICATDLRTRDERYGYGDYRLIIQILDTEILMFQNFENIEYRRNAGRVA
jgi:hypothetical protein